LTDDTVHKKTRRKVDGAAWCRAAAFAYFLYGVIWLWYIRHGHACTPLETTPWYRLKTTPSFLDARAALRQALWHQRLFQTVACKAQMRKLSALVIRALARAA
jgi:hypothetical protein